MIPRNSLVKLLDWAILSIGHRGDKVYVICLLNRMTLARTASWPSLGCLGLIFGSKLCILTRPVYCALSACCNCQVDLNLCFKCRFVMLYHCPIILSSEHIKENHECHSLSNWIIDSAFLLLLLFSVFCFAFMKSDIFIVTF